MDAAGLVSTVLRGPFTGRAPQRARRLACADGAWFSGGGGRARLL
jgi:hypothetical protein